MQPQSARLSNLSIHVSTCNGYRNILPSCYVIAIFQEDETYDRGRTDLVVGASDSGSGDTGSILGRVGVLFP